MTTTTTNTYTIDITKQPKATIREEGKSRLTPFEALYLLELWCDIVEREGNFYFGAKYRMDVCDTLREIEYRNPDWHFNDFENWIKDRFGKFNKKDWKQYYRDVKKGIV